MLMMHIPRALSMNWQGQMMLMTHARLVIANYDASPLGAWCFDSCRAIAETECANETTTKHSLPPAPVGTSRAASGSANCASTAGLCFYARNSKLYADHGGMCTSSHAGRVPKITVILPLHSASFPLIAKADRTRSGMSALLLSDCCEFQVSWQLAAELPTTKANPM